MTTDEDRERARKAWYETDGCNDNGAIEHLAEALAVTRAEALTRAMIKIFDPAATVEREG